MSAAINLRTDFAMELVHGFNSLSKVPVHPVVTIGNFDGVHLGHKAIIQLAIDKARARGGMAIVYTFRPHPQLALRPDSGLQLLSTYDEKIDQLRNLGVDLMIEEPFSREFSTIAPHAFFNDVLLRLLNAEAIVVGYDFAFGREREGRLESLEVFCRGSGVELTVVPPQRVNDEVVSSSRIRSHLLNGSIELANRLLGREFCYRGVVVHGEGRGRKIGFPTANLKLENKLAIPYGVYATWASCDGKSYPSVTNVGVRPTFTADRVDDGMELKALVETHLIGESVDLYGRCLDVRFVSHIRGEKRFPGVEALRAQITADAQEAIDRLTVSVR
jgi:riboflavin kinase / FMN adenylyltransferase